MTSKGHKVYIGSLAIIVVAGLIYLVYSGYTYYNTSLEERFYHPDHEFLKPSGLLGHGLGILGSLFMLIGVSVYMMRKRMRSMARMGKLKHWLEFHIFLCVLGPLFVLFHTSFKFGGLVSISFWSMVAVFLSGIIGRFIYIQIPRSIEGRELSLNEIRNMKSDISTLLKTGYALNQESIETILISTRTTENPDHLNAIAQYFRKYREDLSKVRHIKAILRENNLSRIQRSGVLKLVKNEISINHRIERLQTMQNLFKYWHVAHLPFALLMLIIMVIHVAVTIVFGYRWIY
ncbi:hypothetical protein ACFLTU_05310 [Bacteroidota bacterium]